MSGWQGSLLGRLGAVLWLRGGGWLERKGLATLAETCYRHVLDGGGAGAAEASLRLAQRLLEQKKLVEAAQVCEQGLAADGRNARLWCALGASRRRLARMEEAREAYERAIALDPAYAQAWCNLGEWLLVKGELEAALTRFNEALRLEPALREALNNRAAVLYELGRFEESEAAARRAIELHPGEAALHVNLGNVLLHSGKARPAVKAFYKALECDPASPEANMGLATLLGENHRLAETLAFFEHEIAVKGESVQRLASLALAQQAKRDWPAAEATCRKMLEMQPTNVSALVTLAGCLSTRADHAGAIELERKALAVAPDMPGIGSNIAFEATYLPDISPDEVFAFHREWAGKFESADGQASFVYDQDKHPERPLRIGYVSGDFGTHPVGFLLRDVARHHDRERFRIHCYSMMRGSDDITRAIRDSADAWIDALLMTDDELAQQIHDDRIDILVDLSGHTAYNRLPVFVRRPAPVQVTWIGYFHSTGLESIDYFITDPHTSPVGCGQLYSEIPVYLPCSRFCYSPPAYAPDVASPPLAANGHVTFGSFNRNEKLVDPVIDAWARIVRGTPGSRLVIKAGALSNEAICRELAARFAERGVEGDRLDLRGPSSHPEMLAQYGDIDIALDPFPFNGGMTTLEALWMGVPVVTIAGQGVVSRQTVSALANIGLDAELAFPDLESYVAGAIALAGESERLASLRAQLRSRMVASPLCQPERFARDLEALYGEMWRAWCEGKRLPSAI